MKVGAKGDSVRYQCDYYIGDDRLPIVPDGTISGVDSGLFWYIVDSSS